jgi:hypothetical protein
MAIFPRILYTWTSRYKDVQGSIYSNAVYLGFPWYGASRVCTSMYEYVRVCTSIYYAMTILSQYILVCTSMYWYILLYDYFIIVRTSMYEFVLVHTSTAWDRFEVSFKKMQTALEPNIFCILSTDHTTALQVCIFQHLDISALLSNVYISCYCPSLSAPGDCYRMDCTGSAEPPPQGMTSLARALIWISRKPSFAVEQDFDRPMPVPAYSSPIQKETSTWKLDQELVVGGGWPENKLCGPVAQLKPLLKPLNLNFFWRGNPTSLECRWRFYLPSLQRQDMFYCPMFRVLVFWLNFCF